MSRSTMILLCGFPYVATLFLLIGYIHPAFDDASRLNGELTTLNNELQRLSQKIKEKEVLLEQKRKLDKDILRLRASVPPTPDLDILLIDMERLSHESGTDLIAVEPPADAKKEKGENLMDSIIAEVGGRMIPQAAKKPASPRSPQQPAVKQDEKSSVQDPFGIKHVERRVYVSGEYNQLAGFLKRLEAYQRIVGIHGLVVAMPEDSEKDIMKTLASEKGRSLDLTHPVMTFVMSVYYLP